MIADTNALYHPTTSRVDRFSSGWKGYSPQHFRSEQYSLKMDRNGVCNGVPFEAAVRSTCWIWGKRLMKKKMLGRLAMSRSNLKNPKHPDGLSHSKMNQRPEGLSESGTGSYIPTTWYRRRLFKANQHQLYTQSSCGSSVKSCASLCLCTYSNQQGIQAIKDSFHPSR